MSIKINIFIKMSKPDIYLSKYLKSGVGDRANSVYNKSQSLPVYKGHLSIMDIWI